MAEVAGLVLGVIPLVCYALDKYQDCLEFGRSYAKYKDTLTSIRDGVSVQQMLFHSTMETMGLSKPTYAELEECLQSRFPENHEQFMRCIRKMADTIDQLMVKLEIDANSKQAGDISSRAGWEWRRVKRSLSTKERKKMFDELQHSNNNLRALLSRPEVPLEDSTPMVQTFVARYNQNDCDATSLDLNWHTNKPTKSPVFSVSLSYDISNNSGSRRTSQWRKVQVRVDATGMSSSLGKDEQVLGPPITDVQLLTVTPPQPTATRQQHQHQHQQRSLWSQLRSRSRSISPLPPLCSNHVATIPPADSGKRIDSLCQFVNELDNGGEPLGFLPVPGGTKRVHLETIPGAHTEEATLVHLLPPSKPPAHLKLARRKRFEIATAAAWATLLLCDTPWLNHTWDKHELCFFSENVSTVGLPLAGRCVSMTRSCSLNPQPASKLGIPPHHSNVIRNKAIFALGVLLIELCLNRSFEECKRAANIGTTSTNIIDDYGVAESLIEDVFDEGGEPYGNAVQKCIRFAFPGRDTTKNFSHATFRRHFHHLVVAPIEATLSTVPT
ncbi:hypothetical protein KCU78_g2939, partial [Aureobasidium melanogenum]